jgi:CRISPR-associated protein Cas2
MSLYVAAYDISHNGRRASVARVLLGYGERVQKSVFEVWLEPEEVSDLRREVGVYLSPQDLFDLFPIDERGSRKRVSWQREPTVHEPVILA